MVRLYRSGFRISRIGMGSNAQQANPKDLENGVFCASHINHLIPHCPIGQIERPRSIDPSIKTARHEVRSCCVQAVRINVVAGVEEIVANAR
jgi:hypothetical protein